MFMMRIVTFVIVVFTLSLPVFANTQSSEKKAQHLKTIEKEIAILNKSLSQQTLKKNKALKKLKVVELDIASISRAIINHKAQLTENRSRLKTTQKQLKHTQEKIEIQKAAFAKQLKNTYINGQNNAVKLLLSQQSPAELARLLRYHRYFNEAHKQQAQALQNSLTLLISLEQQQAQTQKRISDLLAQQTQKREQLSVQKTARQQAIKKLDQSIKKDKRALSDLQKSAKELKRFIQNLSERSQDVFVTTENTLPFYKMKNKLYWPIKGGKIIRKHASHKEWKGVFIRAPEGRTVKSFYHGRVVFADWFRGLGLLLIIDHGDGYMSLYGHNRDINKNVGDWVLQNEPIAHVGNSGGQKETGLYFELRKNGKVEKPDRWIK